LNTKHRQTKVSFYACLQAKLGGYTDEGDVQDVDTDASEAGEEDSISDSEAFDLTAKRMDNSGE
jgi:hypothetical protein